MKKNYWYFWLRVVLIMCMGVVGWYFSEKLPDLVPMHWNWVGEADGFGSKDQGLWTIPIVSLIILVLFWLLPMLDPKKQKYQQFGSVWEIIQTCFIGFMLYLYTIALYAAVNAIDVGAWVIGGMGVLFVILGNYMGKIRQNYFVGIKVPWTLNNEEVWNKTHRLGGWCFVIAGLIFIFQALLGWMNGWLFIFSISIVVILPIGYSYWLYKKLDRKN